MNIDHGTIWIWYVVGVILFITTGPYLHKQTKQYLDSGKSHTLQYIKKVSIVLALVLFIFPLAGLTIAFMSAESIKPEYQTVFKTPISKVLINSISNGHGNIRLEVFSPFEKLVLQENRNFRSVDPNSGLLGDEKKTWMTRCYFQPANIYYSEVPADTWVYTNDDLSRAWVGGKSYFPYGDREDAEPEFAKIFRTPFKDVFGGSIQRQDNKIFYQVSSPLFKAHEPLQHVPVKIVDAKSCPIKLPPHVYTEWVTKCYYYSPPVTDSKKKEEFWIFTDDDFSRAFVIGQYTK
jgi:hypothetical protein